MPAPPRCPSGDTIDCGDTGEDEPLDPQLSADAAGVGRAADIHRVVAGYRLDGVVVDCREVVRRDPPPPERRPGRRGRPRPARRYGASSPAGMTTSTIVTPGPALRRAAVTEPCDTEDRYRCQMVQGSANSSSIPHSPRGSLLKPPPLCNSIFNWPCPVLSQRTSCPATTPSGSLLNHSSRFSRTLSSTRNSMGWTTALPTVRDVISDFPQHDGHIRLVPEETNHKPLRTRATSDWARQTAT